MRLGFKRIILVVTMLVCVMGLTACKDKEEDHPVMDIDMLEGADGETYMRYNGTEQGCFQVEEDKPCTVGLYIKTREGHMNVYIAKNGDQSQAIYDKKDITSEDTTIEVTEPGDYKIMFEAENFVGDHSYSLSFGSTGEENTDEDSSEEEADK